MFRPSSLPMPVRLAAIAGFLLAIPVRLVAADVSPAYFVFQQPNPDGTAERFVFKLEDASKIAEARSILSGSGGPKRSVQGTIVKTRAPYNPQWSFHLDPATIDFFEQAIEVCDAHMSWIEKHLDEIGGSALPQLIWCPWSSVLTEEVTAAFGSGDGSKP